MCYLWMLVEGDWHPHLAVVALKLLWRPKAQPWMRHLECLLEWRLPKEL